MKSIDFSEWNAVNKEKANITAFVEQNRIPKPTYKKTGNMIYMALWTVPILFYAVKNYDIMFIDNKLGFMKFWGIRCKIR